MADSPYINWFTSDFLNGVMDLEADQIGVYAVVLNLIADKGCPIDDEPRWIGRRAGCKNARQANRILTQLADAGKIERRNGLIGNARMLKEVRRRGDKSNQAREAARERWARWRVDHRPQLPLGPEGENNSADPTEPLDSAARVENEPLNGIYSESIRDLNDQKTSGKNPDESRKTATPADADAADSRARGIPDPESIERTIESDSGGIARESESSTGSVDRSVDSREGFDRLFERVSEAAGFVPRGTVGYANGIEQLQAWLRDEIDLETTILPCIRSVVAANPRDPTSSLKRFDRAVRHEHAVNLAKATQPAGTRSRNEVPILLWDDEPPEALPIRNDLLEVIGQTAYVLQAHSIRLRIADGAGPHERILHADHRTAFCSFFRDVSYLQTLRRIARQHGLADAWEGR